MLDDIMVDLETLGKKPGCAITAIGAVTFDRYQGRLGDTFYRVIDPVSSQNKGFTIDADTMIWWMNQSEEARRIYKKVDGNFIEHVSIVVDALNAFTAYCQTVNSKRRSIWGNGATFDISILEAAYDIMAVKMGWHYRDVRDVRTIVDSCPKILRDKIIDECKENFKGVKHNALDDAIYQAKYTSRIFQHMTWKEYDGGIGK